MESKYISIKKLAEIKGLKSTRSLRLELNKPESKYISREVKVNGGSDFLFTNNNGDKIHRTSVFYAFKNVCAELGLSDKYSAVSWRKTFAYHHYDKYKDLSYLMWLFNQHNANLALKFIDVEENMNLRFREGVCL